MSNNHDNQIDEMRGIRDLADIGNYEEALRLLDELAVRYPREAKIWVERAAINGRQKDIGATIADWTKAIELCDKEPHYFYMRGIEFFALSQYRSAISDFTKVIELCDFYNSDYYKGPAYFFRADAHLRLGCFEQARSDCMHVRDDMRTWTDKLRTKADILAECS